MKTRLLSALLAALMIVSLVAFPVTAETVAAAEGKLVGTVYAASTPGCEWNNPYNDVTRATDDDVNTQWKCVGQNSYTARSQYFGYYYAGGAVIDSVTLKVAGYRSHEAAQEYAYEGTPLPFNGGIRLEVSKDANTWQTIWEDKTLTSAGWLITIDKSVWDTSIMTEGAVWNYVRVIYGNGKNDGRSGADADGYNYCGWDMLEVYDFKVSGEYVVPADAIVEPTKIAEPLSTTFGTRANLLAESYTMKTDGKNGIGFILKVEGLGDESATMYGIDPVISQTVTTTKEQQKVDEAGELVFDADGAPVMETVTESNKKTYDLGWHGNWVWGSCNKITFNGDGYYMYYVPFNSLENDLKMTSVAGDTTVSGFSVFRSDMAFDSLGVSEVKEGVSVSLVGICEEAAPAGSVFVKDADGSLLAIGSTAKVLDTSWTNGGAAWTNKITTVSDIYTGNGAAPAGYGIDKYVDAQGNEYATDDYLLGTVTLTAVYGERDAVKYTVSASDVKAGENVTVTVKVDDPTLASQGKIQLIYDAAVFTCAAPVVKYDTVAEDGTVATFTLKSDLLAAAGECTFDVKVDATSAKGEVIDSTVPATIALISAQQAGQFITGDIVAINKTTVAEDGTVKLPSSQTLWSGSVDTTVDGVGVDGVTFVYKLDGVETPIVANAHNVVFNGKSNASSALNWQKENFNTGTLCAAKLTFDGSGYYYMYLNKVPGGGELFTSVNRFDIFGQMGNDAAPELRNNTNENATFQMLGVVANNLTPSVKFMNADGTEIATYSHAYTNFSGALWSAKARTIGKLISIDDAFAKTGVAAPTMPNNEDGTPNLFTGWVDENGNPVGADALYYTRAVYAAYSSDYVEYDAEVVVDGDEATLIITGNGTKLDDVVSGTVEVTFNDNVFANSNAVNGVITIPYDFTPAEETPEETPEVEPAVLDTDVLATIVLDIDKLAASGDYDIVINGTAKDAEGNDIYVEESKVVISVDGQNIEGVLMGTDKAPWVDLPTDAEGLKATNIFVGNADFTKAGGVTLVYRATGIETPIDAGLFRFYYRTANDSALKDMGGEWAYNNTWIKLPNGDWPMHAAIEKDGYYFVYLSRKVLGMTQNSSNHIGGVEKIQMFAKGASTVEGGTTGINTNENAKVQVLAVLADNMQPTVNFYNGSELVGSYQYKYSNTTNASDALMGDNPVEVNHAVKGSLLSAADVFAASALATPTKASDENYIYQFKGWVDAEGNPVDAVYYDMDVYADYDKFEKSNKLPVQFYNGTELVGEAEVYENDAAVAPETIPARDEDATGKFVFKGWALTEGGEAVDLGAYPITEATTFYAVFEHVDVTFKVTYTDFNGKVIYTETVVRSTDAAYATIPNRATDAYNEELQGGYKYAFSFWGVESVNEETGEVTMVPAVLTNVQGDITVIAQYDATLVEEWFTVTFVDIDGTKLSEKIVATGEGTSTSVKGNLNGKADENYWYTFKGWDTDTTKVTSDLTVTIVYNTTATTGDHNVIAQGSGTVGTQNDLVTSDAPYTYITEGSSELTFIFDIKGASEENPITIGAFRTQLKNGNDIIDSNNSGNYNADKALLREITKDGKYYATIGVYVMTWVGGGKYETIKQLTIDDASSTRGGKSAGEGTYDVTVIEGPFKPTVRFYDAEGNWLYTGKLNGPTGTYTYSFAAVPTPDAIYAGEAIENFEAWVDADGNVVTEVTENMDVYAKVAHVHKYVTIGQAQIKCTCGDVIDTASTIIAQPSHNLDVKAGEQFTVNIVADNLTFVGATLNVAVEGATIVGFDTAGSVFDGYTAEYAGGRIALNAAVGGENIVAGESETIVLLVLEADKDMTAEDVVTVKVDIEQIVNIANEDITATVYGGYESELTFEVTEAKPLWGDVDGDGDVDYMDALYLTRYADLWDASSYADATNLLKSLAKLGE